MDVHGANVIGNKFLELVFAKFNLSKIKEKRFDDYLPFPGEHEFKTVFSLMTSNLGLL